VLTAEGDVTAWICATCGNQHADSTDPPQACAICLDERQYVGEGGQRWTSLDALGAAGYRTEVRELEPGLYGIGVEPQVGIGQRALLVTTAAGNVLWDIPGFVDEAAIERVRELGGLVAVTASHPHFYGVIAEWSHAFNAPILLPEADAHWLRRPDPAVETWSGTRQIVPGVTLVQCGGHFPGSAVLHWQAGAGGKGVLLTGDTVGVVADTRYLSFMRSFPNFIPLPERDIDRILDVLDPYEYDRIYGGWWPRVVERDAKAAVRRSAERYLAWQRGDRDSAE
jgi:hypothetical protein